MQQLSPYQQAMSYQRKLNEKVSKPLPNAKEFLIICEETYSEQVGAYDPEMHKNLLGLLMESVYLTSHNDAMKHLLHQTTRLIAKIEGTK